MVEIAFKVAVIIFSSGQHHVVVGLSILSVADNSLLVTKITFAMAEIIFKVGVITSSVVKITFLVKWLRYILKGL